MTKPKILLFDVFGTLLDMSGVPRDELSQYVEHVKRPDWSPLKLPESWKYFRTHRDVELGLGLLRRRKTVVAFSNCPLRLMVQLARCNHVQFDAIIPLELARVYKPQPAAYQVPLSLWPDLRPEDLMVITANPTFGDVQGAAAVGMRSQVIRQPGCPADLFELAELLESV